MKPRPQSADPDYIGAGKLSGKVALITGGDSGIGRAVAIAFAKEGADVAIHYLREHQDARETQRLVQAQGRQCLRIAGDVGRESVCRAAVARTVKRFGHLDILVNNAAEQHEHTELKQISATELERTFRTNVFAMFYLTTAAFEHLRNGGCVINSASVTAYRGSETLLGYSASKGAVVAFTRSLSKLLLKERIRVNAVAPGPVWTPLIPASFKGRKVATFGSDKPMGRAAEPAEIAPCYVFLAADDSSYMSGQVLHPNGGEVING